MNMRPFQIIVISVFAVLALLGLLLFATYKGFGGKAQIGTVTIWGTLPQSAVSAALDDLKRVHQEYGKVTYVERPATSFDTDLADALASGTGPDLVIITQEQLLAERGKLSIIPFATIPERIYHDTYVPINELFLTSTGSYAVPFLVDPLVLYYNRTSLAGAGVAQPPKSWEAVVGLAPNLVRKSDAGVISKSAVAFGTYENIPNARAIISLLLLQSGTSISANTSQGLQSTLLAPNSGATYGTLPGVSAMTFYTQFADPAKIVYSWNRSIPDARSSFVAGDSALYVGFASEQQLLAASNPNLDFDMAPVPQPETAGKSVDYARAYALALPKATQNPSGAVQVALSLAGKQESLVAAHALGVAPALRGALVPSPNERYTPVVYPMALIAEGWLSPAPRATDAIFAGMINSIISGRQSVQDALAAADQALNAAI